MSDDTDLLPCPFCGKPPAIEMTGFHLGARTIRCETDDCMGPHTTAQNMDDATIQWNRRQAASQGNVDSAQASREAVDAAIRVAHHEMSGKKNLPGEAWDAFNLAWDAAMSAFDSPTVSSTASEGDGAAAGVPDTLAVAQAMYDWQYGSGAWMGSQSSMKDHYVGLARAAVASMVSSARSNTP